MEVIPMARPLKLDIKESVEDLKILLGKQQTAQGKERIQALYLLKLGDIKTVTALATVLGRHRVTVQDWLARYRAGGLTNLLSEKPTTGGRKCSIPPWAVKALRERLREPQGFNSYEAIQQWLYNTLGVKASYSAVYRLAHYKLKAKLKVAKRQSPKQDPEKVKQFRTYLGDDLTVLNRFCQEQLTPSDRPVRFWLQDETRWNLTSICRRLITTTGVKPVAPFQWKCDGYWLYGLVDPLSGDQFYYEFSHLDRVCFQQYLRLFAQTYSDEWHIIQLDQASAHTAKALKIPENIILMFQPSHAPELNPIERLWEHLKDAMPWQLFETVENLRHHVRNLLENLITDIVKSLTGWDYILDALFVAGIS